MINALYAPSLPNHRRLGMPTISDEERQKQEEKRVNGENKSYLARRTKKKEDEETCQGTDKQKRPKRTRA